MFEQDFRVIEQPDGYWVKLSINMQTWTDRYTLPEDEDRVFVMTKGELEEVIQEAKVSVEKIELGIQTSYTFERLELTYADVHRAMTHEEPDENFSTCKYDPYEDISLAYQSLATLTTFIHEATCLISD